MFYLIIVCIKDSMSLKKRGVLTFCNNTSFIGLTIQEAMGEIFTE